MEIDEDKKKKKKKKFSFLKFMGMDDRTEADSGTDNNVSDENRKSVWEGRAGSYHENKKSKKKRLNEIFDYQLGEARL